MSTRGIGVDIVSVDRIERILERHGPRFLMRCFRPGELPEGGTGRIGFPGHVAGRWAVKEACLKALGCDVRGVPYRDVEVRRGPAGEPAVLLHGRAAAALTTAGGVRILVSLSHERAMAVGFVVIEG